MKVRDEGLLRLKNRVARLHRLLELEAPDLILINEANLVMQAARMLDEQAWVNLERQRLIRVHKSELHLCEEDGCDEPVAWRLSEATPTCPGPFHPVCCERHAKETEAAMAEDDGDDDDVHQYGGGD